jgi:hypothetical protein
MAAQKYFESKIAREAANDAGAPVPMEMDHSKMHHGMPGGSPVSTISIPYEFPSAGDYVVWVQVKTGGEVLTAAFKTTVGP